MYKLKSVKGYVLFLGALIVITMFIGVLFILAVQQEERLAVGGFRYYGRDGDKANQYTVRAGDSPTDYVMSIVLTNTGRSEVILTRLKVENIDRVWTSWKDYNWKVAVYLGEDELLLNSKANDFNLHVPSGRFFAYIKFYCEGSGEYFLENTVVKITLYSDTSSFTNFFSI
ncbi:MAG: hypothetical protein ACFFCD_14335 [Promethearchaeota archaeon]